MSNKPVLTEQIVAIADEFRLKEEDLYLGAWERDRHVVHQLLTAIEPFIPRWETGWPEKNLELIIEDQNGITYKGSFIRAPQGAGVFICQGAYINAKRWMPLPSTTHPYEQLLEKLLNK